MIVLLEKKTLGTNVLQDDRSRSADRRRLLTGDRIV
jgi:hypothetical protein